MSVEFDTERTTLAGSTGINSAIHGESTTETPLVGPGANAGQDGTPTQRGRKTAKPKPSVLVLTCTRCRHPIAGSGSGYAYVSLVDAQKTAQRAARGYDDPAKARWTLAHRGCAPEALAPMSPHHVVWVDRVSTVDALLDAMATLARTTTWHAWTDWGSLVREVLSDTETVSIRTSAQTARAAHKVTRGPYVPGPNSEHGTRAEYQRGCRCDDCRVAKAEQNRANKAIARDEGLLTGDRRHGTLAGYGYWGCRCPECCEANSEKHRQQYKPKASQGIER